MTGRLRAGWGRADITPPAGVDLSGYGFYLDRRAERVLDPLWARALYAENGPDRLLVISCDLLSLSLEFCDAVRAGLGRRFDLPPQNILIAATHTHSGPATHPMLGLGEPDAGYMGRLPRLLEEAASRAIEDASETSVSFGTEICEPIGYNRRLKSFGDIDPVLRVAVFQRSQTEDIYLLNYACHPVVLGPGPAVSADWPGALSGAVEAAGGRGLFLQGFCGDIDPVTNWNAWGEGGEEDLRLIGQILGQRALRARKQARLETVPTLAAREKRIALPLRVFSNEEIDRRGEALLAQGKVFPRVERVVAEWTRRAKAEPASEVLVPLQALAIGGIRILALPGEVFCRYGLALQKKWPRLIAAGCANGNAGYVPTEEAFADPADYASWLAPIVYSVFPFRPEIERLVLKESDALLSNV